MEKVLAVAAERDGGDEARQTIAGGGQSDPDRVGRQAERGDEPLTSLDIHKARPPGYGGPESPARPLFPFTTQRLASHTQALKRVLPGEPGNTLRPYLPSVTKQAWHMDKQSLRGIKRHKAGEDRQAGDPAPAAGGARAGAEAAREDNVGPAAEETAAVTHQDSGQC